MFVFGTCGEHHGSLGLSTHDQTRPASPGRAAILLAAAWAMLLSGVQAHPGEYVFGHGVAFLHELKYPAGFEHFEYINPGAPKGGALVLPTMRPFNTVSPLVPATIPAPRRLRCCGVLVPVVMLRRRIAN